MDKKQTILLTGATGYVGGLLLKRLEREGHTIRCIARNPSKLKDIGPETRVFQGDVLNRSSMWQAFQNVDTAYFLVHFLHEKEDFEHKEIKAAENFAYMANNAGVKRIVYLGGLGNERDGLSPHLQSRHDVGHVLRASGAPTIELRASIVLGDGSLSFNLIRDLTEHLPFMVMPSWVSTKSQPIGIGDLLDYLEKSMEIEISGHEIVEIGGADQMSYGDLMREYARLKKLKRLMIPVPVLSPWLSSHWLSFFTEVDPLLGRRLIEGVKNPTVVENNRARELFDIRPATASEAMAKAIRSGNASKCRSKESMIEALNPAA